MRILLGSPDAATGVLLPAALAAISVSAAIMASAALARRLAQSGKVWVGQGAGRTRVSPYMLIAGLVSAAGALFFLVAGLYDSERLHDPVQFYCWVGIVGASALGALAFLPFAQHTWQWDSTGLRWRGAFRSVEMHWSDLVHLGKRFDGQLYVTDRTGRKIAWWPDITLEHEALLRAIRLARPDLRLPG
jgi:hypothetical protein